MSSEMWPRKPVSLPKPQTFYSGGPREWQRHVNHEVRSLTAFPYKGAPPWVHTSLKRTKAPGMAEQKPQKFNSTKSVENTGKNRSINFLRTLGSKQRLATIQGVISTEEQVNLVKNSKLWVF